MSNINAENNILLQTLEHDKKNLASIDYALENGRIDETTADYLRDLYSDSMNWLREVFYVLGKTFGAPKAAVM